ncbi:SGNH/GDSL hydrolase family protein [Weissella sp. MSCH1]|uniref:SGNH/GDSL hydrolase family protein n=1 Tax=Weissella sp. MSCH1 TaxID=3383343 RepID=UPI003896B1CD
MAFNKIIALGDSITQGWSGVSSVPSWTEQVQKRLGGSVRNIAVGGSTMSGLNGEHNFVQQAKSVDFSTYDAVTIFFGANDFNYYNASLDQVRQAMESGLNYIKSKNANITIFGILPIQSFMKTMNLNDLYNGYSQNDLMNVEADVYNRFGAKVIDWRGSPVVTPNNRYDYLGDHVLHPTAETYVKLGDKIADFIAAHQPTVADKVKPKPPVSQVIKSDVDQWLGKVRVSITNGNRKSTWKYDPTDRQNSIMIQFNSPFSDDSTPSVVQIDMFNLSDNSVNFIRVGTHVVLEAGYGNDIGVISEGKINYVYPRTSDSDGDIKSSFSFLEGQDYESAKDIELSLGAGITASDAISRISEKAGIPLSEKVLKKEKVYKDGYSADGSPIDSLSELAEAGGSKLFYKRGRLVINDVKNSGSNALIYDSEHGLIGYPQPLDWSPDDKTRGYSVEVLLNHRINVGQAIKLNSKYGGGAIYHFRNGEHSFDGENFRTTGEVI